MGSAVDRRRWLGPGDLIGGSLDEVLAGVRRVVPGLIVERLSVTHPGDDDNVYFLGDERGLDQVQVDTVPDGEPPFLIEADDRVETSDIAEAIAVICAWLGSGNVRAGDALA
jgi:hypothetical protein